MKTLLFILLLVFSASQMNAATINLGWTAVADDGNDPNSGAATGYDLRYSASPITPTNFDSAIRLETGQPKNQGEAENYTFTIPDANVRYYFAIKVYDEVGNYSPMSNLAEADFFAPAPVDNLHRVK